MTIHAALLTSRERRQLLRRPARQRAGLAALAGIAAMAVAGGTLPGSSASSSAAASVEQSSVSGHCRVIAPTMTQCVYAHTGGPQVFSVPSWQSKAWVGAGGARGASGVGTGAAQGGRGGEVTSDVSVLPGADLTVMVGGTPTSGSGQGGWPDGGFSRGGGGGGSSSILMGPAKTRILVAGGGGGGGTRGWAVPDPGTPGQGGDGGRTGFQGLNGSNSAFTAGGGYGGSLSSGGAGGGGSSGLAFGGCPIVWMPASSVSGGAGGTRGGEGGYLHFAGTPCDRAGGFGGGGGGGWYAGGGGGGGVSAGAGGGGGSSYASNSATKYGVNTEGFGYVTVAAEAPAGWQAEVAEPFQARTYHAPVTTSARTGPGLFLMDTFGLDAKGGAFHTTSSPDVDENLGGIFIEGSRLASVSWGAKRIDVVGRALHGGLFHNSWSGSSWAGWKRLTPDLSTSSNPTITSWGPGRLDVFVRDETGRLKHGGSDDGGATWVWETFAGQVGGDPTAVSWGPGRIDIFAKAPASSPDLLMHKAWNGQSWSGWSGFGTVAEGPGLSSAPTVVSPGPGRLDLWARGRDNGMISRTFLNGSWTNWAAQGQVPSRPGEPVAAAAVPETAVTVVLARGQLENELWTKVLP